MIKSELQGSFSVKVLRDGEEIKSLPIQNNLILSNMMSSIRGIGLYLHVGTGSTAPQYTDIGLDNYLATSPIGDWRISNDVLNGTVYEKEIFGVFDFGVGAVVGNISELGISASTNPNAVFDTRALFKDGAGDPTTITVTASDQLVVTYYIKKFISMAPTTGQVNLDGNLIDYTIRPCYTTSGRGGSSSYYPASMYAAIGPLYLRVADQNIITVDPVDYTITSIINDGDALSAATTSIITTANGNEVTHTITAQINEGNFQWASAVLSLSSATSGNNLFFQIEFDGPNYITKNNTETVTIKIKEVNGQVI